MTKAVHSLVLLANENTENNNSGRVGLGPPIKAENPIRNMYGGTRYHPTGLKVPECVGTDLEPMQ